MVLHSTAYCGRERAPGLGGTGTSSLGLFKLQLNPGKYGWREQPCPVLEAQLSG